ncbi:MAG: type 4b pilus protein PilO2 [Burkholderia sp.]
MIEILTLPGSDARYAIGLSWQTRESAPRDAELRAIAKQRGRYGVVDERDMDWQAGFGSLDRGMKLRSRLPFVGPDAPQPLALAIAQQVKRPWLGLFDLGDNRFWLIGVRGHQQIVPGTDRVGPRDALLAQRDALLPAEAWEHVAGTRAELGKWAAMVDAAPQLRDLSVSLTPYTRIMYGIAASGAVYLAVLWWPATWWPNHPPPPPVVVPPWTQAPAPSKVVAGCQRAWSLTSLARNGWVVTDWTCRPAAAAVELTLAWTSAGGVASQAPGTLVDATHSTEIITLPVSLPVSSAPITAGEAAHRAIWTLAQREGWGLNLQDAPPAIAVLPASATSHSSSKAPPAPTWQAQQASWTMVASPWHASAKGFDAVPGLRLASIAWHNAGSQGASAPWSVAGMLYTQTGATAYSGVATGAQPQGPTS